MKKRINKVFPIGLSVLLFTNICLYDLATINIYIILSAITMALIIAADIYSRCFVIKFDPCIKWLLTIYLIFETYGLLFLRYGDYNWDFQLFNCVSNIALYICFKRIFETKNWVKTLTVSISVSTVAIILYMIKSEFDKLTNLGLFERIGDSLSGNVNTVGECLGVLSLLLSYLYMLNKKKKSILVLFLITSVAMLLTGSKMTFLCIMIDLLLWLKLDKNRSMAWIKYAALACAVLFLIFNEPHLYNIIGERLVAMVVQLFGKSNAVISHSTSDRIGMIVEGFKIFLTSPIYGGGEKYFAYMSPQYGHYGYSHCNYVEMLCNFGLIGTLIYYVPIIRNMKMAYEMKKTNYTLAVFVVCALIMRFVLDFMSVTHSDVCINYIPMLLSFIILDKIRREDIYEQAKNNNIFA